MRNSHRERRLTMVVSTLLAAALLGVAGTAQHGHRQPLSVLVELESDLRMQLHMAFRHDTTQFEVRVAELDKVLNAWLQSPRRPADRQLLTQWLQQAIRNSMPGSTQPLPPLPLFGSPAARSLPPKNTTPELSTSVRIENKRHALLEPSDLVPNHQDLPLPPVAFSDSAALAISAKAIPAKATPTKAIPAKATPAKATPAKATPVKATPVTTTPATLASPKAVSIPAHKTTGTNMQPESNHESSVKVIPRSNPRANAALFASRSTMGAKSSTRLATPPRKIVPATKVTINLVELTARTAGYHDGLNEIEAALFQLDELDDSQQRLTLAQWSLRQLQQLVDDYQFIKLYYGQLIEKQRQTISAPRSPATLCEQFSHCLSQWTTPREADYLRSFDRDLPELQQTVLRILREDLATLATQVGDSQDGD